jgi:uncharacterized SAM-binding protein YcdF (DUF218 family)
MSMLKTRLAPRVVSRGFLSRLKKYLVVLLVILVLLALVLAFWRPVLMRVGGFLVVDEPPVPSDLVVVSGGRVDRIIYGFELVDKGLAPRMLILASPDDCPLFWGVPCEVRITNRLVELGLREDQVMIDIRPDSTHTDALFSRQDMEREGWTSAVVISDPFHMRRVYWAWRHVFASSDIRLTFSSVPWEKARLALDGWWTRESEMIFVFIEYVKLAFYWVKGYI